MLRDDMYIVTMTTCYHDMLPGRDGSTGGLGGGYNPLKPYPGGVITPQEAPKMLENCLKIGYFPKKIACGGPFEQF